MKPLMRLLRVAVDIQAASKMSEHDGSRDNDRDACTKKCDDERIPQVFFRGHTLLPVKVTSAWREVLSPHLRGRPFIRQI